VKQREKCGSNYLISLMSTGEKKCAEKNCGHVMKWPLNDGQKPLLTKQGVKHEH